MPAIPIIMPQLGESIAEATIVNLLVKIGDKVETDQDIIEVETSKATMNITSPCTGRIEKFLVKLNESYLVGAVLGYLEASQEDAERLGLDTPAPAKEEFEGEPDGNGKTQTDGQRKTVQPTVRGLPVPANATGASFMSPRLKARMLELGLHSSDLASLAGSGAGEASALSGIADSNRKRAQCLYGSSHGRTGQRSAHLRPAARLLCFAWTTASFEY